jgi:hypothetical protein
MSAAPSRAPSQVPANDAQYNARSESSHSPSSSNKTPTSRSRAAYRAAWYLLNAALAVAVVWALYSLSWEISTRRYLKGFSDAIVPATAPAEEKIQAILTWMANGPARLKRGPDASIPDRDPTDTLNYEALLKVCGTATNAFINLVDSGGLEARRLLLLDSNRMTKHVVAEVLVNGRWIIADPAYRVLWHGPNGKPLTREEMANPATFAAVTSGTRSYDPAYTFDNTAHVRMARLRFVGMPVRFVLDHVAPGWEDSATVTLLMERSSFAATIVSLLAALFLILLRVGVRWYGEKHLGLRTPRIRQQFRRAWQTFVDTAS